MAETPEEKKTDKSSEKVENSEASQSKEESKSEVKEVSEKKEATDTVEEKKGEKVEEKKEEKKEEKVEEKAEISVLDDLVAKAKDKGEEKAEEKEEEEEDTSATKGIDRSETDIARAVFPKLDPVSTEYDRDFEEQVVKEYVYGWVKAGGKDGPTLREAAAQVSVGEKEADDTKKVAEKKDTATSQAKTTPGTQAEASVTAEKEQELLEAVKRGNKGAIVELLKSRRKKVAES